MNQQENDKKNTDQPKNDKNYYDVILEEINKKIESDPKGALFLIDKELSSPYVPKEYDAIFKNKLNVVLENYQNNIKVVRLNIHECFDIILGQQQILKPLAMNELRSFNLRPYLQNIQNIFNSTNVPIQIKASVYEFCVEQNINFNFTIKEYSINPLLNKSVGNSDFFAQTLKNIDEKTFKNPSLNKIAYEMLLSYCANNFPEGILSKEKEISDELIWISEKLLGIENKNKKTIRCDKIYEKIFNLSLN